ncbi:SpoIIE family protein phosphatase [Roseofilum capinflatum]|uniref:SpoIIE family protein phosphatase n=1 Tax=Roseofilum capinflatum BLCC-M114 TaxID=3022440 RepID=A0ABT7B0E7_9CYAN|nr:SpoIIE family protein phosphatase [Roseofilum capinflatum]MDJ1172614.1 SpoIIE family protein phosphatase [Roseofilum capinflatum BLCC-M114]
MSQGERRERRSKKAKLMVVDDERDNLDLLYRTFRRDFQVYRAESAKAALEILDQEGEMSIIISDQRMPEMNGTEFLGKTVEQYPDTIRILLTGYTDVEDLVEAINAGKVFKYIVKPWNPTELKALIEQASETYQVIKQSTNNLRRSLRRESIQNTVMTALRDKLDYNSMLQNISETVGKNFEADFCCLQSVEDNKLTQHRFAYRNPSEEADEANLLNSPDSQALIEAALENHQTQSQRYAEGDRPYLHLAVPLIYQETFFGILSLYQYDTDGLWPDEDVQLLESIIEQASLALSQARLYERATQLANQLQSELEVARQFQANLLRQSWPEIDAVDVQAYCYPAREVGGDFFEVYVHPQGDIWVAVGDVSGKGVPAALFMASAISVLRRELSQDTSQEPNEVIRNLNSSLIDDLTNNNSFITMAVARYRPSTQELAYASAGHVYPLVWSHKKLMEQLAANEPVTVEPNILKVRGIPVGILPVWKAQSGQVKMEPGDVLLLTSDGITEAKDHSAGQIDSEAMLNQEGLWKLLIQQPGKLSLTQLLDSVRADSAIQEDDQTLLSLEVL